MTSFDEPTRTTADDPTEMKLVRAALQQVDLAGDETRVADGAALGGVQIEIAGYEIRREISRGGQGVVFLATQRATKRDVAVKVLLASAFGGERERQRFEREVELLAQLRHPNIVTVHDSGTTNGMFYYVMDYIPGTSLDQYVSHHEFSIESTLRLFHQVADAVNAAHRMGVLHRDLKPGNIRVNHDGQPFILDFGLAKAVDGTTPHDQQLSMTGQFLGTLPWASPEQAIGVPGKIDLRTDVYALGVILYQILTGAFPYAIVGPMNEVIDNILYAAPTPPSTLRRKINYEVETILLKCLNKDAERRYQSAGELARDIQNYLDGQPIEAKRDSLLYVIRKRARMHQFQTTVLVLMSIVLVAAGAVAIDLARQLWRSNDKLREAEVAALTNSVLLDRATEEYALPALRQMSIGWFLAARHSGRPADLREIADRLPSDSPSRLVMEYWLDDRRDDETLLQAIGDRNAGLAHFAIGMQAHWDGDSQRTRNQFELADRYRMMPMLKLEMRSILDSIRRDQAVQR